MKRLQAFKYELMPNGEQARQMRRFAGACRFVFNKALALQKENHEAGGKFIRYVAMAKRLTAWRNGDETPWLKRVILLVLCCAVLTACGPPMLRQVDSSAEYQPVNSPDFRPNYP